MNDLLEQCAIALAKTDGIWRRHAWRSLPRGVQSMFRSSARAVIATLGGGLTKEHIAALRKIARLNNIYLDAGVTVGLPKALGEILAVIEAIVETNHHD